MTDIDLNEPPERDEIRALLANTIEMAHDQIDPDGADTLDDQRIQISWARAVGSLTGQYRRLVKDEQLDELREEADLIQHVLDEERP